MVTHKWTLYTRYAHYTTLHYYFEDKTHQNTLHGSLRNTVLPMLQVLDKNQFRLLFAFSSLIITFLWSMIGQHDFKDVQKWPFVPSPSPTLPE